MRVPPPALAGALGLACLTACGPGSSRSVGGQDGPGTEDTSPNHETTPEPRSADFTGFVRTVSDTPFGLGDSTLRDTPVSGSFGWDLTVPDELRDDPESGEYPHRGLASFTVTIGGRTVTGSGWARLRVSHTGGEFARSGFTYEDGWRLLDDNVEMKVDGERDEGLSLYFYIGDEDGGTLAGDALPDGLSGFDPTEHAHTFSLSHDDGTALLQLDSLG
jgi:hypothetical protein